MATYVVKTNDMKALGNGKEPYRTFEKEMEKLYKTGTSITKAEIVIPLANEQELGFVGGFDLDNIYFGSPVLTVSFQKMSDSNDTYMVTLILEFEYDMDAWIAVIGRMADIKRKSEYLYVPLISEFSFSYDIQGNKMIMVSFAITREENLNEVGKSLISLNVALMSAPW